MAFIGGIRVNDDGGVWAFTSTSAVPAGASYSGGQAISSLGEMYLYPIASSAVPATAIKIGGKAYTQSGALYTTTDAPDSTTQRIGGMAVRGDGAVHISNATPSNATIVGGIALSSTGVLFVSELALDFMSGVLDQRITFVRVTPTTDGLYTDAAGSTYNTFLSGVPVFTSRGFQIFEARTNQLLNSAAPALQTTGVLATGTYVFWCIGTGSVTVAAATAVGSGFSTITGSQGTFLTIIITVAGTILVTPTGSVDRFQLELGTFPTPFIPTTGAIATRNADVAAMPTSAFGFNPNIGTLIAQGMFSARSSAGIASINDGSFTNAYSEFETDGNQLLAFSRSGGVNTGGGLGSYTLTNTVFKIIGAYQPGTFAATFNGNAVTAVSPAALPVGVNKLSLGVFPTGAGSMNGWLQQVKYWPQRLTNAELQSMAS